MDNNNKEQYEKEHKYLKYKEFDKNMPIEEREARAFIIAIEAVGLDMAVSEYLIHNDFFQLPFWKAEMEKQLKKMTIWQKKTRYSKIQTLVNGSNSPDTRGSEKESKI